MIETFAFWSKTNKSKFSFVFAIILKFEVVVKKLGFLILFNENFKFSFSKIFSPFEFKLIITKIWLFEILSIFKLYDNFPNPFALMMFLYFSSEISAGNSIIIKSFGIKFKGVWNSNEYEFNSPEIKLEGEIEISLIFSVSEFVIFDFDVCEFVFDIKKLSFE